MSNEQFSLINISHHKYSTFHTVEEFVCSHVQKQDDNSATLDEMVEPNLGNIQVESSSYGINH